MIKKKSRGIFRGIGFCGTNNLKSPGFLTPLRHLDFLSNSSLFSFWTHQYARQIARAPTEQCTAYLKAASYKYEKAFFCFGYYLT